MKEVEVDADLIQDLKSKGDLIDLAYIKNCDDFRNTKAKQASEIADPPSITKNSSYVTTPNNQATFFLIQDNEGHKLISEENIEKLSLGVPQIITELGIQMTESNKSELKFTETTVQ